MRESIAINALRLQEETCDIGNSPALRFSQNVLVSIEWIREGLKKPGKTQRGLAAALGVDPAAVNRLLAGSRQLKAAEIEKVQAYLDTRPKAAQFRGSLTKVGTFPTNEAPEMLPVLGMAEGGPEGWSLWNGEIVQYIRRPDNLSGVPGAYAVFVTGHSMEPRYLPGELAHVHPGRPVLPGSYVLVQRKPRSDGEPPLAVVKRLVRRSGSRIILAQLNPPKEFEVKADDVVSIHRVVGSSEA